MAEKIIKRIDWMLVLFILPIVAAGLAAMKSFVPEEGGVNFFNKQIIWVVVSLAVFFFFSYLDFRFLKRTDVLVFIFLLFSGILFTLFIFGNDSGHIFRRRVVACAAYHASIRVPMVSGKAFPASRGSKRRAVRRA